MKVIDDYSAKEQQQLAVCQRLISSATVPEEIRRDLQNEGRRYQPVYGFAPLKLLGAIKSGNTKGQKIYSSNPQRRPSPRRRPNVRRSAEHNSEFILLIRRQEAMACAIARIRTTHCRKSQRRCRRSSIVCRTMAVQRTALVHKQINYLLKMNLNS